MVAMLLCLLGVVHAGNRKAKEGTNRVAGRDVDASTLEQPHRTGFHFQPEKNWMNGRKHLKSE